MKTFLQPRKMIGFVIAAVLTLFITQAAALAEYPEKPIEIVCWSSPGAPNDLLARQIAKIGQKYFNVNMTVLNKNGGGGAVAMGYLLKKPADGYTLMTTTASQVIRMASGQVPFKPEQFSYIMRIQVDPFAIAVNSDSPFNNLNEFFAYAKENPGKLSVGGFGTASAHFLAFTRLKLRAGDPEVRWIAYDGGAEAVVAALGGHTSAVHTNPGIIQEHVEAGKMKVLGISVPSKAFPDFVSYKDQGYDLDPVHWRGLMAQGDVSDEIVQKVRELMEKVTNDPEFIEYMKNDGTEFALMDSPAVFQKWVASETIENRELMQKLDLIKK